MTIVHQYYITILDEGLGLGLNVRFWILGYEFHETMTIPIVNEWTK